MNKKTFELENKNILPQLHETLNNAQFDVFALSQSRPSLDDVYLQATGKTLLDAELEIAGKRDVKLETKKSMR